MSLEDSIQVIDLGKRNYEEALDFQINLLEKRKKNIEKDTLILTEHPPTITLGGDDKWNVVHASEEDISKKGIAFFKREEGKKWVSRGGGAAYLGPGQIIGYAIMDITSYGINTFLRKLEEVMIRTAKDFDIEINRVDKMNPTTDKLYRATWYQKNGRFYVLCTKGIGVRVERERLFSHHGFALNVNNENSFYELIDPCGFPKTEIEPISMQTILGKELHLGEVKEKVVKNFGDVFERIMEYGICV